MYPQPSLHQSVAFTALLTVGVAAAIFSYYRKRSIRPKPENLTGWKHAGTVQNLWIYPIKSCRGIALESLDCTKLGPKNGPMRDREFLFVNDRGNFITARQHPKLVLVEPKITENEITLKAPGMEELRVAIPGKGVEMGVTVWGEQLKGTDCGEKVSAWISGYLGEGKFRMVYHADRETQRTVKTNEIWPLMYKEDGAAFSDLAPYLLINEDSVQDLRRKLKEPDSVSTVNFRPNIVISGSGAFSEDNWSYLRIGGVVFRHTKPCDRCVLTTVNPEKGEKDPNQEPLRTLKEYRCATDPKVKAALGTSPLMGINLATETLGQIKIGDTVEFI